MLVKTIAQTLQKLKISRQIQRFSTEKDNNDIYVHPVNYNFEQYKGYKTKVDKQIKEKEQTEMALKEAEPIDLKPRRKRRQYDRPKYDLDISKYGAWRVYDAGLMKNHENGYPVVCKIPVAPKVLRHVFGNGIPSHKNNGRATAEYNFEDNNCDYFLIYDWKATTEWWGENIKGYDYENQEDIYPRNRKIKQPSLGEFWDSEETHEFRVNCSRYGDWRKFRKWVLSEIEAKKDGPSYEEIVKQKFGELDGKDDYNKKDYEIHQTPSVFEFDKSFWLSGKEKLDAQKVKEDPYYQKLTPGKQLDDKYLVSEEQQKKLK